MAYYGNGDIFLKGHWRLMGALEALNGMMLLGLTSAFLLAIIRTIWTLDRGEWLEPEPADVPRGVANARPRSGSSDDNR